MPDNEIVAACEEARAVGHRVLAVQVLRKSGRWIGRIMLAMVPAGGADRPLCPEGVRCSLAMAAPPDIDVPLPALTSEEGAEHCIQEVARVGQAIDYARFDRADGVVSFLTKPLAWGRVDFRKAE